MHRTHLFRTILAAVTCTACSSGVIAQEYTLTPLGFLPNNGTDGSWSWGISESGLVSGEATSVNAPAFAEAHVWDGGVMTGLGNLSTVNYHSRGMDVNDAKEVCGWASTAQGWQAFKWDTGGGMVGLGYAGAFPGGEGPTFYSQAYGINQAGQITGTTSTTTNPAEAFIWDSGTFTQLLGFLPGDDHSVGHDINNASPVQVTGMSAFSGVRRAFLWDSTGGMVQLATPGGNVEATGNGLNDLGDAVGWSDGQAIAWFLTSSYVPQDLGSLGGAAIAWDVNNDQHVVGSSEVGSAAHAFIWDPCNLMRDLNNLVDGSGSGWVLWYAYSLNDNGQIAGWGRNPAGDIEAFILDPLPGACCTAAGCVEVVESECQCLGGTFFGAGTKCTDVDCQTPVGACCHANPPICTLTTAADCDDLGGTYYGDYSLCTSDLCDPTVNEGACCRDDGAGGFVCFITTAAQCQGQGGFYQGDGTTCTPDPCNPQDGACCVPEPGTTFVFCIITTAADCQAQGGTYQGDGTTCSPDPCEPLTGACCVQFTCFITTGADCQMQGGTYYGDGSPCTPGLCEPPLEGACCHPGVPCYLTTQADCEGNGGIYFGDGTSCFPDPCQPEGACCVDDPTGIGLVCIITTASDCQIQGGIYQGDGTTCSPDPCEPEGACCREDPDGTFSCFITTGPNCAALGGFYQGDGTTCVPDPCNQPEGACCIPEPGTTFFFCIITTAADCQAQSGFYQGDGTSCTPDPCNEPTGACCVEDPAVGQVCIITTAADCQMLAGIYFGDGSTCTPDPCIQEGACCVEDPFMPGFICFITTATDCAAQGGLYQGDGTSCVPDPCPDPTGACCVENADGTLTCIITTMVNCQNQNGVYYGDGSTCVPDPCGPPTGACCIQDATGGWTCVVITGADCQAQNGIYFGDGSTCVNAMCPEPEEGACCLPEPGTNMYFCIITTQLACDLQAGIYQGDGTTCSPDPCNPTGACCLDCGCINLPEQSCIANGGFYMGDFVFCDEILCPNTCGIDLSTGTTGPFVDPFGTVDPDWTTVSTPTSGAGPAYSIAPVSAWTTTPGANWIDPYNTGGSTAFGFDPVGDYVFEIQFVLDTSTMSDFVLDIDVASDNASDFYLNGCLVGSLGGASFGSLTNLLETNQSCFVNGVNTLRAEVNNASIWMGLLVEGKVTWRKKVADITTGTTGIAINAPGTIDPDWSLLSTPTGGATPAFTITPVGSWATSPWATWIDPYNNGVLSSDPAGTYVYQTQFLLDYSSQQNFVLNIGAAADNSVSLFLNGNSIGSVGGFGTILGWSVINQSFFNDGLNTLTAQVVNNEGPSGLIVTGEVTAECRETDCNGNGIHDFYDIMFGTSNDANSNGIPDECECEGDTNGDGVVDVDDLINVILDWGTNGANNGGDVNGDGIVDVDDLVLVIINSGPC